MKCWKWGKNFGFSVDIFGWERDKDRVMEGRERECMWIKVHKRTEGWSSERKREIDKWEEER